MKLKKQIKLTKLGPNLDDEIYRIIKRQMADDPNNGAKLEHVTKALIFHGCQCAVRLFKEREYAVKTVEKFVRQSMAALEEKPTDPKSN